MDPSRVYFLNEYYLIENLSVRLVEMDANSGYKLMLASSITQKSDTEYQVQIKDSKFSNGELIALEDVKRSLERATKNKNSHINFSEILKDLKIEDGFLSIKLNKRTNDFLYYLTLIDLSILHKNQIKDEIKVEDWSGPTSGAFTYQLAKDGTAYLEKNKYFALSKVNYPERVHLFSAMGRDSFKDFAEDKVDLGEFNLNSYESHLSELGRHKNLQVIGNTGDMITFLALNARKEKFSKEYNRRWIQKKILKSLKVREQYKQVARKAFQFFTPQVRGFLDEKKIIEEVDSWELDLNEVPKELKNGIVISTYTRAFEVTIESIVRDLETILGIPVKIENNISSLSFEEYMKKGDFDIFMGITAMDQVIAGESVNLYYFSSSPMLIDVNKKIKPLMDKYKHSSSEDTSAIIKEVSLQMTKDAECIPLFYVASPFFYNKDKVNVSHLDELTYFNLWKIEAI